jgi:hypothetical protein
MATSSIYAVTDQDVIDTLNNQVLSSAAVAAGTGAGTIKTTVAMNYRISGQQYSKAITDNIALTATGAIANGVTAYYLLCIDAAGAVTSTAAPAARAGDPDTTQLLLGAAPANTVPFCVLKVVATAAYTPGTTALGAQGTFANIGLYPMGEVTALTFA